MKADLQNGTGTDKNIASEIAAGMLRAVNRRYMRLFEVAKREWEREYAGPEASDACVSVRIRSGEASVLTHEPVSFASAISRADSLAPTNRLK